MISLQMPDGSAAKHPWFIVSVCNRPILVLNFPLLVATTRSADVVSDGQLVWGFC